MLRFFGFFFSIILIFSFTNAFADVNDFTTNQSLYHDGDQILISGDVSNYSENPFIIIQIITPDQSDIVGIDQISASSDGSFTSNSLIAGGSKWSFDGFYTVKIIHNGFLEKSIEYQKLSKPTPEPTPEPSISESISNFSTMKLQIPNFPALDKSPQYYLARYNDEPSYKSWFDSQFPNDSIYNILGYEDPVAVPDWVRNNAHWWSQNLISEDEFVNALKFMIQEGIIIIN